MCGSADRKGISRSRADKVLPGLCFLLCLVVLVAAVAFPKGMRVVVVAAPGTRPAEMLSIIMRSGGSLVAASGRPWVASAQGTGRDFASRLFANGAILVLDDAAAFLCTSGTSEP